MLVGALRRHPAARGALQEALLQQVGLVEVLERAAILADRGGERLDPRRAAAVDLDQGREDPPVELVEAEVVDLEQRQRLARDRAIDRGRAPSTWAKSRTRRSSRLAIRGVPRLRRAISSRPAASTAISEDARPSARTIRASCVGGVEVEPVDDAEARAQRRRDQPGAGGGADQGEARQVDLDVRAAGPWPMTRSSLKSSRAG